MKYKKLWLTAISIAAVTLLLSNGCAPLREFGRTPVYNGENKFVYKLSHYDRSKKTVVIVANNDGTELFDMMSPFYLFNATGKANVYVVAKNKVPIVMKKGLFLLPQSTFGQLDSLQIKPDVIVIPFLTIADSVHQDPVIINWIRDHYSSSVTILSVCDGAATAAATGLFDGKPITAHASDYAGIKPHFSKPLWTRDTAVVHSGNLYSTAGVSNATEGSLLVIQQLFGSETMRKVIADVAYPYEAPRMDHQSNTFSFGDKMTVAKKLFFTKHEKLGVLLQNGMNEFQLAGVMDSYNRTIPGSIESFSDGNAPIVTKYGLTILPTGRMGRTALDELHVIDASSFKNDAAFKSTEIVKYDAVQKKYIIDVCLQRINNQYGGGFEKVVRLMLDYN